MTTQNTTLTRATTTLTWSDEMGSRSRHAWLLLLKGEQIVAFTGSNIPGIAVIRGKDYHKNGKWSHTTYRLELATGVRPISGRDGWETGEFAEGLRSAVEFPGSVDTWADMANAMKVSVPSAMAFLKEWRPKVAAALDEVDAQLTALDEAVDPTAPVVDMETVVVSFGGPTNRAIADGFWKNPKSITGHNGELRLIDVAKGWKKDNIRVAGMIGTILSATHASGYHGGYVSVTVAVVPGSTVVEADVKEPVSDEEVAERNRLAELMAWEIYGRKPLEDDLGLAQRVDAFVKEAIEARGSQAYTLLKEEADEAYGRGGRTAAISEKFPGVAHHGLDWASGRDIVPVTFWAEKLSAHAKNAMKKPATTEPTSGNATMADLLARFGRK